MRKQLFNIAIAVSLFLVQNTFANNIAVSNIGLTMPDTVNKLIMVQFDLSWENSWRNDVNWDAAWVFVKYSLDEGSTWLHASLSSTGHIQSAGANIDTPDDSRGVFIYRETNGAGIVNFNSTQLSWNYGLDSIGDDSVVRVKVFAIEMVLVPEAAFTAGSGGTAPNEFTLTTINTADATMAGAFPQGRLQQIAHHGQMDLMPFIA